MASSSSSPSTSGDLIRINNLKWILPSRFQGLFPIRANFGEGKTLRMAKGHAMLPMDNEGMVDIEPNTKYQLQPVPGFCKLVKEEDVHLSALTEGEPEEPKKKARKLLPSAGTGEALKSDPEKSALPKGEAKPKPKPAGSGSSEPKDKRPVNGFMRFAVAKRPEVVAQHPEMKFTEVTKLVGEIWNSLTPEQRKPYDDAYEKDKAEYDRLHPKDAPASKPQPKKKALKPEPAAAQPPAGTAAAASSAAAVALVKPAPKAAPKPKPARSTPAKAGSAGASSAAAVAPSGAAKPAPKAAPSKPAPMSVNRPLSQQWAEEE